MVIPVTGDEIYSDEEKCGGGNGPMKWTRCYYRFQSVSWKRLATKGILLLMVLLVLGVDSLVCSIVVYIACLYSFLCCTFVCLLVCLFVRLFACLLACLLVCLVSSFSLISKRP